MPIGNAPPFVKLTVGLVVKDTIGIVQLSVPVGAVQLANAVVPFVVKLIFEGQAVKTGGIISVAHGSINVTVTVKLHVAVLFLASVAVYLTVVVPIGNAPPFVKPTVGLVAKVMEGVVQLSVAVGAVQDAIAVVPVVVKLIFEGQAVKTGGIISVAHGSINVTVTVKLHVAVLFLASVAVYLTVVVPIGNAPPFVKPTVGLVAKVMEGVVQLSVAVGAVQDAIAVVPVVVKLIFEGQAVKTGGIISVAHGSINVTVTVKLHVAVLFLASVAVYLTVVVPIGNAPPFVKPAVGLVVKETIGILALSVAVGAVHEATAVVPVVVKLILVWQAVKTGGVTSI